MDKPIVIDEVQIPDVITAATPLDFDPARYTVEEAVNNTSLVPVVPAQRPVVQPLMQIHTPTLGGRLRSAIEDGEAVIVTGVAAVSALSIAVLNGVYSSVAQLISLVTSVLIAHWISLVLIILGTIVGLLVLARRRGPKELVLRGCPRGPTPGSHRIRL